MFLYHLNHTFANQSIVSHVDNSFEIGDCMADEQGNYYLVLGTTIHRDHLYKITQAPAILSLSCPLLSSSTIQIIHHLTYEYYTNYTNIINLYLPHDITKLLSPHKTSKVTQSKKITPTYYPIIKQDNTFITTTTPQSGQQLIIMPDRRTMINYQHIRGFDSKHTLGSQHTSNQDITWFWNLKSGLASQLICTPGECFRDYHDLKQIILIDPHKRYYKSQQDPRYDIMRVCELMAHYHECELLTNT